MPVKHHSLHGCFSQPSLSLCSPTLSHALFLQLHVMLCFSNFMSCYSSSIGSRHDLSSLSLSLSLLISSLHAGHTATVSQC